MEMLARNADPTSRVRHSAAFCGLVLVLIIIVLVLAYSMWTSRQSDWKRAAEAGHSLAKALEAEIASNILDIDIALQGVQQKIQNPAIMALPTDLRRMMLFDRAAAAQNLSAIVVTDERGDPILSSLPFDESSMNNRSDREYFIHHRENASASSFIGRPINGRSSGLEVITVSRRLNRADGSFGGVVIGALDLDYFKKLFAATALGERSNITLVRSDGVLLMRWPYAASMIGRDTSGTALFTHFALSNVGQFESKTLIDGEHRLISYRQIKSLPLILGVGQATDVILAQWFHDALLWSAIILVLCVLAFVLATLLFRELRQRAREAHQSAHLAMRDGLTGLYNRRFLDTHSKREWSRAVRNGTPLSLAMIDVDHFKSLNDRLGHQYGDEVLRRLGMAIAKSVNRGADLGARYGGDEFAILLPDTDDAGAQLIIDRIRAALTDLCSEGEVVAPNLSVGIASMPPTLATSLEELLNAADMALYSAKAKGRNQTVVLTVGIVANVVPMSALPSVRAS